MLVSAILLSFCRWSWNQLNLIFLKNELNNIVGASYVIQFLVFISSPILNFFSISDIHLWDLILLRLLTFLRSSAIIDDTMKCVALLQSVMWYGDFSFLVLSFTWFFSVVFPLHVMCGLYKLFWIFFEVGSNWLYPLIIWTDNSCLVWIVKLRISCKSVRSFLVVIPF